MSTFKVWSQPSDMNTKERILYEAERLFAAKGYTGTGIGEIARKVGITKSVIYYHFKNKEAILDSIFKRYSEVLKGVKESLGVEMLSSRSRIKDLLNRSFKALNGGKWNEMASILIMESIKEGREKFIFDMWDKNLKNINENFRKYMKQSELTKHEEKFRFITFFVLFMPELTYTVFAEKWSKYYEIDMETLRNWFTEVFTTLFQDIIVPKVYDENKMGFSGGEADSSQ